VFVEKSYIRMEDAYSPGMRPWDSLLLQRHLDPVRDSFLLHIAHISASMAIACLLALIVWFALERRLLMPVRKEALGRSSVRWALAIVAALSGFLLLAPSSLLWHELPELWIAQLPWRVLFVLGCCLALAWGFVLDHARFGASAAASLGLCTSAVLAIVFVHNFRWECTVNTRPQAIEAALASHHSPSPTEEYVLNEADAEYMRPDNPPYWFAEGAQDFAAGTTPNTTHDDPTALMPVAPADAKLSRTPLSFRVVARRRGYLIVNLEHYPNWTVKRNGRYIYAFEHRPDGLIAFAVPEGDSMIEVRWRHTADEWVGALISFAAMLLWCVAGPLRRRTGLRSCTLVRSCSQ
jgi:hypothetical protein